MVFQLNTRFLFIILALTTHVLSAQKGSGIEVHGRVVEMVNGKIIGVPKISVAISNDDYDITEPDGSFTLYVNSSNQKFVRLSLTGIENRQMITPIEGVVNIPPSKNVEIMLCSQQNQALKKKVVELNSQVKSFQTKYNLSSRQVQNLQKEMLDTIMFYEQLIQIIKADAAQQSVASKSVVQEKDNIIKKLEMELERTMRQLIEAKDERFLQKQKYFQSISAGLRQYLDALQNLRDMLLPDRVSHYFINTEAINQLNGKINAYNSARDGLLSQQDAHLTAVQHYWNDPSVKQQLAATYTYILNEVHDKTVYPVEFTVNDAIKKYTTGKLGRQEAQKKATQASKEPYSRLTVMMPILEEKITLCINNLKQDF